MASEPALADLGFGRPQQIATSALGLLPGGLAWALGAAGTTAAIVAIAGAAAILAALLWIRTRLRSQLCTPLDGMVRALEQLRSTGHAGRMHDGGAPVLQPMQRSLQLAFVAIEERISRSQANLLTVESAFDRVHAVLQSLREGVLVVDQKGRITMANRSARVLVGSDDPLEGRQMSQVFAGELAAALDEDAVRLEQGTADEVMRSDLPFQGRIFDLTLARIHGPRPGQDFGKVLVLADVTRNHELNALKDDLLSSISHELRTPLTNMCSSSEILATLSADDEHVWREFVAILNAESRRLKLLVDDVMEYSQLETRRTRWNPGRVDLGELARTAAALVQPSAAQRNIALDCSIPAAPVHAFGDGQRLVEAISRMLENAVKFTPEHGRIELAVACVDGMAQVTIADSGVGIAPADRERVFERFAQIGSVMTEKPAGTGLGLSIVRRIVDAQGGTIWCEDSPLGGAQFRFVLPIAS